jgi:hypothetical protein
VAGMAVRAEAVRAAPRVAARATAMVAAFAASHSLVTTRSVLLSAPWPRPVGRAIQSAAAATGEERKRARRGSPASCAGGGKGRRVVGSARIVRASSVRGAFVPKLERRQLLPKLAAAAEASAGQRARGTAFLRWAWRVARCGGCCVGQGHRWTDDGGVSVGVGAAVSRVRRGGLSLRVSRGSREAAVAAAWWRRAAWTKSVAGVAGVAT